MTVFLSTGDFTYNANQWYTVAVLALGTGMTVTIDGVTKWAANDSAVSGTKMGLRTWYTASHFDDAKVRRLVSQEPTVSLGGEETWSPSERTKYYYAGTKRIAMRSIPSGEITGTLYYMFADHLGGTSVVFNTTTGLTNTITFYPFGGTRTGSVPTDYQYTGQRLDSTGLYDYGARMYDPYLGRFISPDTVVPGNNNPQGLNRYSYSFDNPLKYIDPTGHDPEDWLNDEWKDAFRAAHGTDPTMEDYAWRFFSMAVSSGYFDNVDTNIDSEGKGAIRRTTAVDWDRQKSKGMNFESNMREAYYWGAGDVDSTLGLAAFTAAVWPNTGRWDFKADELERSHEKEAAGVLGDFHFGAVAAAYGLNEEWSMAGAIFHGIKGEGWAEPPEDRALILVGREYYRVSVAMNLAPTVTRTREQYLQFLAWSSFH